MSNEIGRVSFSLGGRWGGVGLASTGFKLSPVSKEYLGLLLVHRLCHAGSSLSMQANNAPSENNSHNNYLD